jgi:type II secretory pathway pseudopilin PulG
MQKGIIAITLIAALGLALAPSVMTNVQAQAEATKCQTGALIGYGGTVFGVANVCTNGYTINVDLATNYLPKEGWVFNAWLVDDYYEGSGYPLVMGKVLNTGTLSFDQIQTNARTWTDIVVTQQPADSLSPLPSWSNSVAQTWLAPPFGQ